MLSLVEPDTLAEGWNLINPLAHRCFEYISVLLAQDGRRAIYPTCQSISWRIRKMIGDSPHLCHQKSRSLPGLL